MPLPAGYTLDQPQAGTAPNLPAGYKLDTPPTTRPDTSGSMALDFMQGGGAELIKTALGAYNLLRKIPGADKVLPAVSPDVQQYAEPPKTAAAKIGGLFTSLGEFALPAGEAAGLTKGAGLLARAGAQAAAAGGVEAARTGGDVNKTIDAAALGAAGPVVGAGVQAAVPLVRNVSGGAFDAARFLIHPTPYSALRLGQRIAGAASKAAEEAAPAVDPLLDKIAQGFGVKDFSSLGAEQQATVRELGARMTSGQAAAAAPATPPAYTPRPPEYYGVKPAETPPTNPATNPPAPSTAPEASAAPPAPANVQPIRPEPPQTAADIAKAQFAQAKADRFVKAIQDYNAKFNAQPITADSIADLDDSAKGVLARALSGNGLLPKVDANKFPNTSWPYIVTKLRQAEYSSR